MNAIEKIQHDIGTWYDTSPVSQFMRWWSSELKTFVPEKYHEKLFSQTLNIYIVQQSGTDNVELWVKNIDEYTKQTIHSSTEAEQEKWWHTVLKIINEAEGAKVKVEYLLPSDMALIRKVALPIAAKENLEEVIGFELDKYVPFSLDQVQLDYKIDKENTNEEKLVVDLAVIPKPQMQEVLNHCEEIAISLDGIDINQNVIEQNPNPLGVNLLPTSYRKPKDFTNLKINAFLMVMLVGLVYFVMHTSLANKQDKIERLSEINSQLKVQARNSKLLRKELKEVIVSSKFLQTKKENHPKMISLISEMNSILPSDTYLTHLKINQERIEIIGESENANSLVPKLDDSKKWFAPGLVKGIRPNQRTNKERFTIQAQLNEPKQEGEDGTKS